MTPRPASAMSLEGLLELAAAVARGCCPSRSPTRQARCTRVSTGVRPADVPLHQRHVHGGVHVAAVGVGLEARPRPGARRWRVATRSHQPLALQPVADDVGDREQHELVLPREAHELGAARHRAVVVHDLADDAGGLEPGQAREIHASPRSARCAPARRPRARAAGRRGPGAPGRRASRSAPRRPGWCGRGPRREMPVVTPRARLDGDGEGGAEGRRVVLHHQRQARAGAGAPR